MCLNNTKAKARFQGRTTEEFDINKEVKQGDSISPTLFNLVLASILRKADLVQTNITNPIHIVAYADDLTLISRLKERSY